MKDSVKIIDSQYNFSFGLEISFQINFVHFEAAKSTEGSLTVYFEFMINFNQF